MGRIGDTPGREIHGPNKGVFGAGRARPILRLLIALAVIGVFKALPAEAQITDSQISAVYKIHLTGIPLGEFVFRSQVSGNRYAMRSETKISPPIVGLFFEWKGATSSQGNIAVGRPRPAEYRFHFRSNKKRGEVVMAFRGNRVASVTLLPKKKPSAKIVPVTRAHLAGVLDPMSALMVFTRRGKDPRSVCRQHLRLFDGQMRFDLKLSFKKMARLRRSQAGYSGPAIVCRVTFLPISGYKRGNKSIQHFAKSKDIEIWLIPLRGSRNFVPYHISLPTPVGKATATAIHFQVRQPGGRQYALVRN